MNYITNPEDVCDNFSFLDFLDERDCWYNDLNGRRKAHMDSYMTIPDYANIDKAIAQLNLSNDLWEEIIDYCNSSAYCSPNSGILGALLKRKLFPKTEE